MPICPNCGAYVESENAVNQIKLSIDEAAEEDDDKGFE